MQSKYGLIAHTLENGLRVLIKEEHAVPKVSVQLWYNVGSKDEQSGEKGLAHLLEHMIFKGTQRLSESDINVITHKLSGYTNAFTSYDYTGYLFDFPTVHWKAALDMLADCMTGCTFKEDLLQSELKAVIQELKMYKDDYQSSLVEQMTSSVFSDHPYHYPIIGYKQDLCAITQKSLLNFYKKHYVPNNATLVIVGDVHAASALKEVKAHFEHIPANYAYHRPEFYAQEDTVQTSITLYRDIQRPMLLYAWRVPGLREKKELQLQVIAELLASQTSGLYRLLVDDLEIATDVQVSLDELFEHSMLLLMIDPSSTDVLPEIAQQVQDFIARFCQQPPKEQDIAHAYAQLRMEHLLMLEKNQEHAYALGKYALATDDPEQLYAMMDISIAALQAELPTIIQTYITPTSMHEGRVLPLKDEQRDAWRRIQQEQDRTDALILARKVRESVVEAPCHALQVHKQEQGIEIAPHARVVELENGMRLLLMPSEPSLKAELMLMVDELADAEPVGMEGITEFLFALMQEGTTQYSKTEFMEIIQAHGMQLSLQAGVITITCFKKDIALVLQLVHSMLTQATLHETAIEKIRQQLHAALDDFWDTPTKFVAQLARAYIYEGHPWSHSALGTHATVDAITRDALVNFYTCMLSPARTRLVIVADEFSDQLIAAARTLFADWQTPAPQPVVYPSLPMRPRTEILYPINRDQVVLAFAGNSITRQDPRYDALQIFDQILLGGIQLSMSSRLFALREQTGLFYTIGGSMMSGAGKQPGMRYIRTIVSGDRLAEAEQAILQTIAQTIEYIDEDEFVAAQDALIHALIDQCGLQRSRAQLAMFMDMYQLPHDYILQRIQRVRDLTSTAVRNAAAEICAPASLSIIKAGRW